MPTYRPATLADNPAVFQIFFVALADLARRNNFPFQGEPDQMWEKRRPMFDHLANTAEQFWVAEEAGAAVGYARAVVRDGCRELTELFVHPGAQGKGIGTQLLKHAFLPDGVRHSVIVAAINPVAVTRYLKAGVSPRFPSYYFGRAPEALNLETDLEFEAITETREAFHALRKVDEQILNGRRDIDHAWLLGNKTGFLYRRQGHVVGYGYLSGESGPFALLDDKDFPAVLAHAETYAHAQQLNEVGFEVPLINRAAVTHLLQRGYRMDPFGAYFMSDKPFGKFENYLLTSPPFFM